MITVDLDRNPRVAQIIELALQNARPVWLGFTNERAVEIWQRKAIWMNEIAPEHFTNGNAVSWKAEGTVRIVGACLAEAINAVPFGSAPIPTPLVAGAGDTLMVLEGTVTFRGKLPR